MNNELRGSLSLIVASLIVLSMVLVQSPLVSAQQTSQEQSNQQVGQPIVLQIGVGSNPEGVAYDPSNGYMYVTNFGSNTVSVISGLNVIANIQVGSNPEGVAYDPSNGYVYVANTGSNTVSVISGLNVIANITVGSYPYGVAYDPSNGYMYVTNSFSNTVSVISGLNVIANITVGSGPEGVAYDPSNGYMYVTNFGSGTVSVISGLNVIANITVGYDPACVAYDPSNGYMYVTNFGSGTVSVISGLNVIANITVGSYPEGVAYDPSNGYMYVANSFSNTVSVISGLNVIANITVGSGPEGVAYDPSNGYMYVTNFGSGTVSVISGLNVIANIQVGSNPEGVAYDPSNGYMYVTNSFSGTVSVISGLNVIANIQVGSNPEGVAYDPSNGYMYVTNSFSGTVSVISGLNVIANITVGSNPEGVAYDPSNGYMYVTNSFSGTVSVISGLNVIANITVGSNPEGVAYDPSNGYVYVANTGSNTVSVISGLNVIANITVGSYPYGVAYDPSNGYMYVTNSFSNTVSVISGLNVIANITVGSNPEGVAYDPSNGYMYVTNSFSNTVSVISGLNVIANITVGSGPEGVAYDPSNGYVYVTNSFSGTVSVISGLNVIANITVGSNPEGVAYDPSNGYVYVTNSFSGTVSVISGLNVIANITVGSYPYGVAYDPSNGYMYVTNPFSGTVSVISGLNVIANITVGSYPYGVAYDPSNGYMYVTNSFSDTVSVISGLNVIANITVGYDPACVAYDPSNGYMYVANFGSNTVSVISGLNVIANITVGSYPYGVAYDPSNGYMYVANSFSDTVSVISGLNVIANIQVGSYPYGVAYDPSNGYMYVANSFSGTVSVISGLNVIANMKVGSGPWGVAYDPSNGYVYVTISGSGTVLVLPTIFVLPDGSITTSNTSTISTNSTNYNITFHETGLPKTTWSVTLNGTTKSSSSSNIVFTVNPGTYSYTVGNVSGYVAVPQSGTVTVTNSNVQVNVTFTPVPSTYQVTFVESGLPSGTSWSVTLNGTTESSTTNTITFYEPNGVYHYTVNPVQGYTSSPSSGTVVVNGSTVTQSVTFSPSETIYSVTFTELGLPPGTPWSVTLNGTTESSISNSLTFTLPEGTYYYSVSTNLIGYHAFNGTRTLTVTGNETINLTFTQLNAPELAIYSEYVKYFFSPISSGLLNSLTTINITRTLAIESYFSQVLSYYGLYEPNVFYVNASEINGSRPVTVYGYIDMIYRGVSVNFGQVNFTYNPSIGMWESNTVNMALFPTGNGYLTAIAKYPDGQLSVGTYPITVLLLPTFAISPIETQLEIHLNSSTVPTNSTSPTNSSTVPTNSTSPTNSSTSSSRIELGFTFLPQKVGLINNTYLIDFSMTVSLSPTPMDVNSSYANGSYSTGGFNVFVNVLFDSDGNATVIAGSKVLHLNGKIMGYPIEVEDTVYGTGDLSVDFSNLSVKLEQLSVNDKFSAFASFPIPTPWGIEIPVVHVKIGLTVVVSGGFEADVGLNLVPTNNRSQELLGVLPIALSSVKGHVFAPLAITGVLGGGAQEDGSGIGVYGWAQGDIGVGEYLGVYPKLSAEGGALVGQVNVGGRVDLIVASWSGSFTLLGPGVIYQWGNVSQSQISELENQLQEASSIFTGQAIGQDWVNGSTFGLIAQGLPLGYAFTDAPHNGSEYVYYTASEPNSTLINGVIFKGPYEYPAPLPHFQGLGVASPYLVGSNPLSMVWFAVPKGSYSLNNLTVLLQGSTLEPNGTWEQVFNVTHGGDALSVTSDGKYLYILWEPRLELNYSNTELLMTELNGQEVADLKLPGVIALNGALNGSAVVQFANGSYAVVNVFTGNVERGNYTDEGYMDNLFYSFGNDTMTVINGTSKLVIKTPSESYAWPGVADGKLFVFAYRPSVLTVYQWNGTALLTVSNYPMPGLTVVKPVFANGYLYVTALTGVTNTSNASAELWNILISLPQPTTSQTNTNSTPSTTSQTNTTTVSTTPLPPNAHSENPLHRYLLPILIIIIVVAVIVIVVILRR